MRSNCETPTREKFGENHDGVHSQSFEKTKIALKDKYVTLNFDRWPFRHNAPIISVCATENSEAFLLVDTTRKADTSENLLKLAEDALIENLVKYKFKACGFVTGISASVQKMRKALSEQHNDDVSCSDVMRVY